MVGEKIWDKYQCRFLVNWGKPLPFWTGQKFVKKEALGDFPGLLLVSESRVFLMTEYTKGRVYAGVVVPIVPVTRQQHRILYMELALDKIEENLGTGRKFAYFKDNALYFKPHGQLGRTKIVFQGLVKKFKKEIDEKLQKARALNLSAPDAGILITDRPLRQVYEERMRIINAQQRKPPTPEATVEKKSDPITFPTVKYESIAETEPTVHEKPIETEKSKPTPILQHESTTPIKEIELTQPLLPAEKMKSKKSYRTMERLEEKTTAEKVETPIKEIICPNCGTRININTPCPKCGSITLNSVKTETSQVAEPSFEQENQQPKKLEAETYPWSKKQSAETLEKLEKTWRSLALRETICPYCKKRVLTIDRRCPHCGAINL